MTIAGAQGENEILRMRALSLAKREDVDAADEPQMTVVEFRLDDETYALEAQYVSEVFTLRELTPVPGTPPFVIGIVNVRGEIISINDLRQLLGLRPAETSQLRKVVVLQDDHMRFGIAVDSLDGACRIPVRELQPPPTITTGTQREYVKGVTTDNIFVLGGDRLLQDHTLRVDATAQPGGAI